MLGLFRSWEGKHKALEEKAEREKAKAVVEEKLCAAKVRIAKAKGAVATAKSGGKSGSGDGFFGNLAATANLLGDMGRNMEENLKSGEREKKRKREKGGSEGFDLGL